MTGDVNDFVLGLYRACQRMPHTDLRPWVFAALQEIMHFDSAVWFRRSGGEMGCATQDWYVYRQPESFLAEYISLELWRDDTAPMGEAPDGCFPSARTFCAQCNSERLRRFMKRYRVEHRLTSSLATDVPAMVDGVSLLRDEARLPFSEDEAATMEQLMPHVVNAWRESRLRDMARSASSEPFFEGFNIAVLRSDLAVSELQAGFADLLRLEWPRWQGPVLPPELQGHLRATSHKPWSGKTIAVYIRPQADDTLILLARRVHTLDGLAPRKRHVALLFSRGASQTQIARQLQLSPSTVNNYIGIVYEKLELRNKIDLSRLFVRLEP